MSKNKKGKVIPFQPISIEKYIKDNARKLAFGKCFVLEYFADVTKNVMVSRVRKNGSIIVGMFLVDCGCLGLKDTYFLEYNSQEDLETDDIMSENLEKYGREISPNYAQNLIYGAIEWAEDAGLPTHKEFKVTEYLLDPADEIEYEEIEFGKEGKYFYVEGPEDNTALNLKILNKNIGEGNYVYISKNDSYGNDTYDDDDDFENDNPYLEDVQDRYADALDDLIEIIGSKEKLLEEEILKNGTKKEVALLAFAVLVANYIYDLLDEDKIDKFDIKNSVSEVKAYILENLHKEETNEKFEESTLDIFPLDGFIFNCIIHDSPIWVFLDECKQGIERFFNENEPEIESSLCYMDFWANMKERIMHHTYMVHISLNGFENFEKRKAISTKELSITIDLIFEGIHSEATYQELFEVLGFNELCLIFKHYPVTSKEEYLEIMK